MLRLTQRTEDGGLQFCDDIPRGLELLRSGRHALLVATSPEVRVDGQPVASLGGITVVGVGTEICSNGDRFYLVKAPPTVVEEGPQDAICPLCRNAIAGKPAVQCPETSRWYHQTDEFPCWDTAHPQEPASGGSSQAGEQDGDQPGPLHPWEVSR